LLLRRGASARGPSRKPTRKQRFYSVVFKVFLDTGEWPERKALERHFLQAGAVEFCKSWPRLSSRYVRFEGEDELVVLSVDAIAQVDGAQIFLGRWIDALKIAIDQYQGSGKPMLSVTRLVDDLAGVTKAKARCILRLLESEGLLTRGRPDAAVGVLTPRLARYTGAVDAAAYLKEKRRLERGRLGKRVGDYVRRLRAQLFGPESSLWVQLTGAAAVLVIGVAVSLFGGLFEGDVRVEPSLHVGAERLRR
jgi:hypothetical protein